ncbi:hypothetical protein AMECASPLE_023418 [Ameca splendens]|uniref:Uncharacterized protein n=1 Tax=Ameca splendens TaxID=208324 RepID=A0ABV0Y412_9TELE
MAMKLVPTLKSCSAHPPVIFHYRLVCASCLLCTKPKISICVGNQQCLIWSQPAALCLKSGRPSPLNSCRLDVRPARAERSREREELRMGGGIAGEREEEEEVETAALSLPCTLLQDS